MNKPTEAQLKEFWKWCGWKWIKKSHLVNEDTFEEYRRSGYWKYTLIT